VPTSFGTFAHADVKTRDDVFAMGIGTYNEECRSIVMRYSKEWETIITRMGRWIDFEVC
jgi:isoleucyl-tRNA synthetase